MTDIPSFPYDILWGERVIRSVANLTRQDGEEFLENGWLGHVRSVDEELVRVPLIVRLPMTPYVSPDVTRVVETRAVFPTVLEYLGVSFATDELGPSLLPLTRLTAQDGEDSAVGDEAFTEVKLPGDLWLSAIRTDAWKLTRDHDTGIQKLYDVRMDPLADHDVSGLQPNEVERLAARLDDWHERMAATESTSTRALTPEDRARLRALGYIR